MMMKYILKRVSYTPITTSPSEVNTNYKLITTEKCVLCSEWKWKYIRT